MTHPPAPRPHPGPAPDLAAATEALGELLDRPEDEALSVEKRRAARLRRWAELHRAPN